MRRDPAVDQRNLSALTFSDPRHGTANGYNNCGCRCDRCREAWRLYRIERRRSWGIRPAEQVRAESHAEAQDRHGIHARYRKGCRCDECKAAMAAYKKEYRERRPEYVAAENWGRKVRHRARRAA